MDKEVVRRYLKQGLSLPQIGKLVGRDPSTVGYWVRKHGLVANGRDKYAPRGGVTREQLQAMCEAGLTGREMADELGISTSTVHYWLRKFDLHQPARRNRPEAIAAKEAGLRQVEMSCRNHGMTTFILKSDGGWRCAKCSREAVVRWRRRAKRRLVEEAGGQCQLCGYDFCISALEFHHLEPGEKSFGLSARGITRSIARLRAEAKKCVLLCGNCHAEVETGLTKLPVELCRAAIPK